jgi:stage II sporulation protein GA (sporulation sigma-E factor processing peptidase)
LYFEVYPDIIFVLNFIIDFILLYLVKKINRKDSSLKRRLFASAFGAASIASLSFFPWISAGIRFLLINICSAVVMLYIAFGRMRKVDLLKQAITLYLITYFLGGLINSVYYHTNFRLYLIRFGNSIVFSNISWRFVIIIVLMVIPITVLILWIFRIYQSSLRETLDTEIVWGERSIHTRGLVDTGNCLYDPIFKKPVIILEKTLLGELLEPELLKEFDSIKSFMEADSPAAEDLGEESSHTLNIRLIPYKSIGKPQGMMLGFVLDKVVIYKGKDTVCNEKVTAAICDNHLSTKEEYHVILHKELL